MAEEMKIQIPDYVHHYYDLSKGPLRSLTDEGPDKAREIHRNLVERQEGFKGNRDSNYVDLRLEVEAWLRNDFIKAGGQPKRKNPHYFILGESDWMLSWYPNTGVFKKSLTHFDPTQVSFTYPDSMVSYLLNQYHVLKNNPLYQESSHREYHGKVFLLHQLAEIVSKHGMPQQRSIHGEPPPHERYIEIQVWDDIKNLKDR